jgi:hypothetical protein
VIDARRADRDMIDAIREIIGLAPLYRERDGDDVCARVAQDQIDALIARGYDWAREDGLP